MNSSLEKIRSMSIEEQRALTYQELVEIITPLTADEIIKLSNIIGYPVFTRLLMGELKHRFVLLQDGAAAVILNDKKQILLQSRADRDKWGLPGGCQELGERFVDTVIREIKEETNLDVNVSDLKLIDIVSGSSRRNDYPNGDVVINNTVLYMTDKYTGELKWDSESKDMRFFDLDKLPENLNDPDLIKIFLDKYDIISNQKRGLLWMITTILSFIKNSENLLNHLCMFVMILNLQVLKIFQIVDHTYWQVIILIF